MRSSWCCLLVVSAALAQNDAGPGAGIFRDRCSVCHGADASGTERGPGLAGNGRVRGLTLVHLRRTIHDGIPEGGMPGFNLPATELDAVTAYVRSMNATAAEAHVGGDRAAGERFFFGTGGCGNCHMALGRGKAVGPDLSNVAREMSLAEMEEAVRHPSARIAAGYELVNLELRDGRKLRGFARNRSIYSVQVQDFDGNFHLLTDTQIARITSEPGSLMPALKCTGEECTDLFSYLCSLTGIEAGIKPFSMESRGGLSFDEIAHPRPGNWPTYHGDIGGNRHSPLDQINAANVRTLAIKWIYPIDNFTLEATPVVVNGVMYVTGPNQVFALDAQNGRTIWHYARSRSTEVTGDQAKGTNRGVAVLGDRVFLVTDNAHVVALHRVTGQLLWETPMVDEGPQGNYGSTAAPLVVNDLVIAGVAGGDMGIRGFLSAYRVTTGERVWRFYTVPKPGEPKSETWKGKDLGETKGGGATWMSGTYDPETRTLFWGVGNPYPAMDGDERQGDNLYSASVLALESGYRCAEMVLPVHAARYPRLGRRTDPSGTQSRLSRQKSQVAGAGQSQRISLRFRPDQRRITTCGKIRRPAQLGQRHRQGRQADSDSRRRPTHEGAKACPSVLGASNWMSVAYSDSTKLFYVQALEACGIYVKPPAWKSKIIDLEPGQKVLRAIDLETGRRVWEVPQLGPADSWGGVLSTAGGVVFFGEDSGAFAAVDARTGKDLWHLQTNASKALGDGHSWRASPMTFLAGGRQYVAVAAGPNILCLGLPE